MIKCGKRKNLFYPIMSIIFAFSRKLQIILMDKLIDFKSSLLLTMIMFLAEIISGMIVFIYEKSYIIKKISVQSKFMGITLIQAPNEIEPHDSKFKMYIYIFIIALIDFFEFSVDTLYFPKYDDISNSLYIRLRCTLTLFSAILSAIILKFSIYEHQKVSLLVIFFCLITIIVVDYVFEGSTNHFFFILFLIFINYFFDSIFDIIEKYLLEYDFVNPFKLILVEGTFGFILASFYTLVESPFKEAKKVYEENNNKFILLISFLIIYFFLCAGRNIYRVITNKLYFPITRSLTDSIFDPLLIIYYYFLENDFYIKDKDSQNIVYFIINLIISIIYVFFGCVYNEVFILFCCGLDHNTYDQISNRASILENQYEYNNNEENYEENNDYE